MIKKKKKLSMNVGFVCTEIVYNTAGNPPKVKGDLVFGEQ